MMYEQGKYGEAESILCNYVSVGRGQSADAIPLSILWGKLAARVMQGKVCDAIVDFNVLKHAIEHKSIPAISQLHHRSWLLHWGLFLQFGVTPDETSPEIFNDRYYLQTIENTSPWILRYYACSVVLFGRRKTAINDLLREVRHIKHEYSDCFTDFMQCLYEQFDFGDAQRLLKTCVETMRKDYFLQNYAERFIQQARMLICEVYCQLNRTVELSTLATKLQLSEDEAEHWMVEMVRNASVSTVRDARIDSSGKKVLMSAPEPTGRNVVADATRDLSVRSALMASQLEKVMAEQSLYAKATK
jgi:translation initiation factor 3 subunit E